jgi:transcription-repair coupling factor (superfamily II helicase)
MSVQSLLERYQHSPHVSQLVDRISIASDDPSIDVQAEKIILKDLRGSAAEFVAASTFLHPSASRLNHVFVCNDEEEAAYFHNTLENLTQALNIVYFPSSYKNKKNYRLMNA